MMFSALKLGSASIMGRLVFASIVLLPVICGVFAWTLDRSFTVSLVDGQKRQMTLQAYALMAAADYKNNQLELPLNVSDDRLNQVSSGNYAYVFDAQDNRQVWQSGSAIEKNHLDDAQSLPPGKPVFRRILQDRSTFYRLDFLVEWEDEHGSLHPFVFSILESDTFVQVKQAAYRQTLFVALGIIAGVLTVVQVLILLWGLKPLRRVVEDLQEVQQGQAEALQGEYPKELKTLTQSVNQLIKQEHRQREKYRHALADLAHSIKTPVAIITGALTKLTRSNAEPEVVQDISEQSARIDQIVSYQLARAVGQSTSPFLQKVSLRPVLEKLIAGLNKVYHDKAMQIALVVKGDDSFRGDEGDITELCGNLLDNACKYGYAKVRVTVEGKDGALCMSVEDDGPGISAAQREILVIRGKRADTTSPGQGIGLAVVDDIVRSYNGSLEFGQSDLGGLLVVVRFDS